MGNENKYDEQSLDRFEEAFKETIEKIANQLSDKYKIEFYDLLHKYGTVMVNAGEYKVRNEGAIPIQTFNRLTSYLLGKLEQLTQSGKTTTENLPLEEKEYLKKRKQSCNLLGGQASPL